MPGIMKYVALEAPKKLILKEKGIPQPGPGQVLMKIIATGVCGTDVSVWKGKYEAKPEVVLGHEFVGTIEAVGSGVTAVEPGDNAVPEASWGCGDCYWCKHNLPSYCEQPNRLGRTIDGSLAEYVLLPENVLHRVPKKLSPENGQGIVGIATALRAVARANIKDGDKVIVIGPGYAGLIILQLCKHSKASIVGMLGTRNNRLEIAKTLGADFVANIRNEGWEKEVKGIAPHGFDVCIEAAGVPSALLSAMELVKKGGTILEFGTAVTPVKEFPQKNLYQKEISIIGSKGGFGYYDEAVAIAKDNIVDIKPLISHQFLLPDSQKAFESVEGRVDNILRAVIVNG